MMKGRAARIPICRLLAPRARAKAARKPLVVMLKRPIAAIPSKVNQRNPDSKSCSEMVGLGLRKLNGFKKLIGKSYNNQNILCTCNYSIKTSYYFPLVI
jgi:hypothetical protein